MRYQHLFSEIAGLAGLHFEHDVPIEHSDERRQGLVVTVDAAVLLDEPQADRQDAECGSGISGRQGPLGGGERFFHPVDQSATDLLGDYLPAERKIVIYKKVCASTAGSLGIPYEVLEHLVALHEISHAVTHLGEEGFPGSGIIWEFYPHADLWDKELFAQIYPLFHLAQNNDQVTLDAFRMLSLNQLAIYNLWQIYQHIPLREINKLLSLTRLKRFCVWMDLGSSRSVPAHDSASASEASCKEASCKDP
jgi:hypothetical protein